MSSPDDPSSPRHRAPARQLVWRCPACGTARPARSYPVARGAWHRCPQCRATVHRSGFEPVGHRGAARRRPSPYRPLADYLAAQPAGVAEVTLTAPEIERIIGASLPAMAQRRPFWSRLVADGGAGPVAVVFARLVERSLESGL